MSVPPIVLSVRALTVGFDKKAILPPLNLEVRRGEVISIVGPNGSGKSTLLRTLLGLMPKVGGGVHLFPETRIGYVPQREAMDPIYPIRVCEVVEAGRYGIRGIGRALTADDRLKVRMALDATGIASLEDRLFRTLSGGEQQRALIARAHCAEPSLLVLDEPTASMDEKGAQAIMDLTLHVAKLGDAAVLMVNHFIDLVERVSDRVVALDREAGTVRVGPPSEIFAGRK